MRVLVAIAVLACLATPAAAVADSATSGEVRALAARAADDPDALEQLRRVDEVDGRPIDLRSALDRATGDELRGRLRSLAAAGGTVRPADGDPRADARRILAGRRFHESHVPRLFHGLLVFLGDKLDWLARPFEWLADVVPGGPRVLWIIVGLAVVALAIFVASRVGRRRAGRALERLRAERGPRREDPARLEREADAAERRGDLETALRLRFRAGLIRLERADAIRRPDVLTGGHVRRLLGLEEFDELARDFDEVVYGRRPPRGEDVETARRAWPRVIERARR